MRERDERDPDGRAVSCPSLLSLRQHRYQRRDVGKCPVDSVSALRFERRLLPFITSVEEARRVVAILDSAAARTVTPLAFSTIAVEEIRQEILRTKCPLVDFFGMHMESVESILEPRDPRSARLHGMGDVKRYNARMAAVEYAIEHDDGQSMRALDKADVILVAPSLRQDTPTTMYLALQHGISWPTIRWSMRTSRVLSCQGRCKDCGTAVLG